MAGNESVKNQEPTRTTIRGSMTLSEAAVAGGISVETLQARLGIASMSCLAGIGAHDEDITFKTEYATQDQTTSIHCSRHPTTSKGSS